MRHEASRTIRVGPDQGYPRRGFLKAAAWGAAALSAVGMGRRAGAQEREAVRAVGTETRAPIVLSSNSLYDGFGQRGLFHTLYGGADFGEVTTTAVRIGESTSRRLAP